MFIKNTFNLIISLFLFKNFREYGFASNNQNKLDSKDNNNFLNIDYFDRLAECDYIVVSEQ